jgi:hypothetical protein
VFYREDQYETHEDQADTVGGYDGHGTDEEAIDKPEKYSGAVETYHEK